MSSTINAALLSMTSSIDGLCQEIEAFSNKDELSETDMLEFNVLASEYSTMMSLASGLIKTLADAQEGVVQKM